MPFWKRFHAHSLCFIALILIASCTERTFASSPCSLAVQKRLELNAFELFEATNTCASEDKKFEANLVLLTGQVRAMTDMTIFEPAGEEDKIRAGELYGLIYARYGGSGFDEPYVEKFRSDELFDQLRATPIELKSNYSPGWSYKSEARKELYDGVASDQLAVRLWNVEHLAKLLQIPAYLDAHQAMNKLISGQGAIDVNSPVMEDIRRLQTVMDEAANGVEKDPKPVATVAASEFYSEPDEEGEFRQVASGLNGPASARYDLFKSADEVRSSWIASHVTGQKLEAVLADIDFETETLGALAMGKRRNLSGNVYVTDFNYAQEFGSYSMNVAVGVLPEDCKGEGVEGFPFALAVTSGGDITGSRGRGTNNFPDTCPEH